MYRPIAVVIGKKSHSYGNFKKMNEMRVCFNTINMYNYIKELFTYVNDNPDIAISIFKKNIHKKKLFS